MIQWHNLRNKIAILKKQKLNCTHGIMSENPFHNTSPGTMVHVMHMHFMFFTVFKNLKSSFSEDNMPGHSLDIFIEKAI